MYKFEKSSEVTGKANINNVWGLYENVENWSKWDQSLQNVVLEGAFIDKTKGTMFFSIDNMPPLPFELSDVNTNERFVSTAILNGIVVKTDHVIQQQEKGLLTIKHIVTVEGENERMIQGIGMGLTSNLENFISNLIKLAQKDN